MKKTLTLILCLAAGFSLFANRSSSGPGCDTLVTLSGKTLIIRIKSETKNEVRFHLCDDTLQRTRTIAWKYISRLARAVEPANNSLNGPDSVIPRPAPDGAFRPLNKNRNPADTCDLVTHTNGKQYQVRIVDQDMFNYFYTLCDDPDGRVYMVSNRNIRSVRRVRSASGRKQANGCLTALMIIGGILLGIILIGNLFG